MVMLSDPIYETIGLSMQPACIQRKHLHARFDAHGHIDKRHVFGAAERYRDVVVRLQSQAQNIARMFVLVHLSLASNLKLGWCHIQCLYEITQSAYTRLLNPLLAVTLSLIKWAKATAIFPGH